MGKGFCSGISCYSVWTYSSILNTTLLHTFKYPDLNSSNKLLWSENGDFYRVFLREK